MSKTKLNVNELEIVLFKQNEQEYISLTDMVKFRDSERTNYIIQNWMRTRNTIEFLGLWEQLRNPNFNSIEFDAFRNESGSKQPYLRKNGLKHAGSTILLYVSCLKKELILDRS